MDGDIGFMDIKPDQIQFLNPFLILIFIPLYEVAFYPVLNLVGIRRPLQKLTLGGIFAAIAFVCSGLLEMSLEPTYPVMPSDGFSQLRIFNGMPCNYTFEANLFLDTTKFNLDSMAVFEERFVKVDSGKINEIRYSFTTDSTCTSNIIGNFEQESGKAVSYLLRNFENGAKLEKFEDNPDKSREGTPLVRIVSNVLKEPREYILRDSGGNDRFKQNSTITELLDVPSSTFSLLVDGTVAKEGLSFKPGGVYTIILRESSTNQFVSDYLIYRKNF